MDEMWNYRAAQDAAAAERDCYTDWIDALRVLPGNPWRADVGRFGQATVVCCAGCPARIVNRCFGLDRSSLARLGEILAFFSVHDATPSIDLVPFGDYEPEFFDTLAGHGLRQSGFHQILVGHTRERISTDECDLAGVKIERVGTDANAAYGAIHERVFGPGTLVTSLLSHPSFHCFLATWNDQPAALGVLHVRGSVASMANGITLPEFRRRGLQLALLRRRMEAARQLGCDLAVSQANPANVSMRNQLRTGLSLGGTKAIWSRSSSVADGDAG
jgi:hypothetical protein